jgi:hypothetical protein
MTSLSANYQVCRRKILTVGREYQMARGYTSIGPMAPFYVFPCGHAFHAQCLIAQVTRCTNETQVCYGVIFLFYLFPFDLSVSGNVWLNCRYSWLVSH